MRRNTALPIVFACLLSSPVLGLEGDATRGARAFRACTACHSLEPNRNMTGPSLAGVLHRKAGTASGFTRYSDVMRHSDVIWDDKSLDGYLKDPAGFMPGNHMTFQGISDDQSRADVVAFLKEQSKAAGSSQQAQMQMMPLGRGGEQTEDCGAVKSSEGDHLLW
jgi:cytochrome c